MPGYRAIVDPTRWVATLSLETDVLYPAARVLSDLGTGLGLAGTHTPLMDGTGAIGTAVLYAREDHVHPTDTSRAPLASPTFTGTPAAPTAAVDTNTTQLASCAFVIGQASASGDGTPAAVGTAARGTSTHFARADHVHPKPAVGDLSDFTNWQAFTPTLGAGAGTFTATVKNARYVVIGKTLVIQVDIQGASVSQATTNLTITVPGGFSAAANFYTTCSYKDNGTFGVGSITVQGTTIYLAKDIDLNGSWAVSSGNSRFGFVIAIQIS